MQQGISTDDELAVFQGLLDATTAAISSLRPLTATNAVASEFAEFVAVLRKQQTSLTDSLATARRGDRAATDSAVAKFSDVFQRGIALERQLDNSVTAQP